MAMFNPLAPNETDRVRRNTDALKFLRGDFQTIPSDPEQLKKNPATDM